MVEQTSCHLLVEDKTGLLYVMLIPGLIPIDMTLHMVKRHVSSLCLHSVEILRIYVFVLCQDQRITMCAIFLSILRGMCVCSLWSILH